jgi:cell fate (sporulation/competence/biofilm development) regulator YmcA (YheA/YmcA/DUF963 family)
MDVKEFPRKQPDNFFNYTEDELAEKTLALETMKLIYKDVPSYYAELAYDLCKNTSQEKIDEIKKKIESTPFKYDYSNLQEELNKVKDAYPTEQKDE